VFCLVCEKEREGWPSQILVRDGALSAQAVANEMPCTRPSGEGRATCASSPAPGFTVPCPSAPTHAHAYAYAYAHAHALPGARSPLNATLDSRPPASIHFVPSTHYSVVPEQNSSLSSTSPVSCPHSLTHSYNRIPRFLFPFSHPQYERLSRPSPCRLCASSSAILRLHFHNSTAAYLPDIDTNIHQRLQPPNLRKHLKTQVTLCLHAINHLSNCYPRCPLKIQRTRYHWRRVCLRRSTLRSRGNTSKPHSHRAVDDELTKAHNNYQQAAATQTDDDSLTGKNPSARSQAAKSKQASNP